MKTNKFMGEAEFDNLMGKRILKKTLPVGESLPKIYFWASNFLSSVNYTDDLASARPGEIPKMFQVFLIC